MALTLRRFFQPAATIRYPEVRGADPAARCAVASSSSTTSTARSSARRASSARRRARSSASTWAASTRAVGTTIHWGPAETYGERREESALRRSGRPVPDATSASFAPVDLAAVDAILDAHDHDPRHLIEMLTEIQDAYGYLPVAALKHLSFSTGAWYAMVYGTATYYRQFRLSPPAVDAAPTAPSAAPAGTPHDRRLSEAAFLGALDASLGLGGAAASEAGTA